MVDPTDTAGNAPDPGLRQSQLLNRLVIDRDTAEEVGHVDQILVDTKTHQVEGLTCRAGSFGRQRQDFGWVQLHNIGRDSLVVRGGAVGTSEKLAAAQAIGGLEVWTDSGDQVGNLVDCIIDRESGAVQAYLFASDRFRGMANGVWQFSPSGVISVSRKRMMINESTANEAEQVSEGIAAEATEFLKNDYAQTREDWQSAVKGTKAIAEQFQSRAQQFARRAKRQFSERTQDLQAASEEWGSEVQKKLEDVKTQFDSGTPRDRRRDSNISETNVSETVDITPLDAWIEDEEPKDRDRS
ncbi:MAG: PRC-barrel domain-containing protein [Cyanobacteria bacterium P01_D01_bin.115]